MAAKLTIDGLPDYPDGADGVLTPLTDQWLIAHLACLGDQYVRSPRGIQSIKRFVETVWDQVPKPKQIVLKEFSGIYTIAGVNEIIRCIEMGRQRYKRQVLQEYGRIPEPRAQVREQVETVIPEVLSLSVEPYQSTVNSQAVEIQDDMETAVDGMFDVMALDIQALMVSAQQFGDVLGQAAAAQVKARIVKKVAEVPGQVAGLVNEQTPGNKPTDPKA